MSKTLTLVLSALCAVPPFGGTALSIGKQSDAPVQITQTLHDIPDLLSSAQFENKSIKVITAYRVGWVSSIGGKAYFQAGPWMAMPAGAKPGTIVEVPAQKVEPNTMPDQITFFISDVRFADGSSWKATKSDLGLTR